MRILSSAEYCLRVARRMSLMSFSAGAFRVSDFCLIFAPLKGYDEPEILPSQSSQFGPISAEPGQVLLTRIAQIVCDAHPVGNLGPANEFGRQKEPMALQEPFEPYAEISSE